MEKPKSRFAEALEALGYKSYRAYLNSPHWKKFRAKIIGRDRMCLCCGGEPQEVHHKRYKRLGKEKAADAVALCRDCHEKVHETHRREKIVLGDFVRVAGIIRREHGFVAPISISSPASSPPLSLREKKRRKKAKRLRRKLRQSISRTELPAAAPRSSVEDLPLFAMRFVIAASLKGGKTLDRIQLEMRCSREHLDRVTCWLSKQSMASITPDRPCSAPKPAKGRPKGLRGLLDKHRA